MSTLSAQRSVIETEETQGSPGSTIRMLNTEANSKIPEYLAKTQIASVFREAYITAEYSLVTNAEKLGGLYVIPSQKSCNLWFGVLFIHQGPYLGGIFRFIIQFPEAFPETTVVPTIVFQPPVFHPCVHPIRGTFDIRRHFKSWNKTQNHAWQLLRSVRAAFNKVEMSTQNKTAHDMFLNDPDAFMSQAKLEAEHSIARVYDPPSSEYLKDPHWIKFSQYDSKLHDQIRAKALKPMEKLNANSTYFPPFNTGAGSAPPIFRGTSFMRTK